MYSAVLVKSVGEQIATTLPYVAFEMDSKHTQDDFVKVF
jgi:hypothetical protein